MSRMSGLDSHPDVKLTYDDFALFPEDDGQRHELIDGVHVVSPCPNTKHQTVLINLVYLIRAWLEDHPVGRVFAAPFDVVLSNFDVVEPDLLYMSNQRADAILTAQHVRGVPELVVEIGSPGTQRRDDTIKKPLYERSGVSEYWMVDPVLEVVRVYRQTAGGFKPAIKYGREADDTLRTPLLPGLDLPLSRIF
jgi:Uma2 family endonuclease